MQQGKFDTTDPLSNLTDETMVPSIVAQNLNTKKIKLMEKGDDNDNALLNHVCKYCGRGFKSDKALGGHLRIHSGVHAKSKAATHRTHHMSVDSSPEEDGDFGCFVCDDSFTSMKLLCQHMRRNHREVGSSGVQPSLQTSSFNEEPQTQTKENAVDLWKDLSHWSQTGKRGRKRSVTVSDEIDDKIYSPMPLNVCYGSAQSLLTSKKQRSTEEIESESETMAMPHQLGASMGSEFGAAADSESRVELFDCSNQSSRNKLSVTPPQAVENRNSNDTTTSSPCKEKLKNRKAAKSVKSEHKCEICGKTFQTGPQLGGHKSYHRVKPVDDPLKGRWRLYQKKPKEELLRDTAPVKECMTRMLFPGALPLPEEAHDASSEGSYQQHPKRQLDFDLNIPYVE